MRDVFDTFLRMTCNCKGQGKTFANDRFARYHLHQMYTRTHHDVEGWFVVSKKITS